MKNGCGMSFAATDDVYAKDIARQILLYTTMATCQPILPYGCYALVAALFYIRRHIYAQPLPFSIASCAISLVCYIILSCGKLLALNTRTHDNMCHGIQRYILSRHMTTLMIVLVPDLENAFHAMALVTCLGEAVFPACSAGSFSFSHATGTACCYCYAAALPDYTHNSHCHTCLSHAMQCCQACLSFLLPHPMPCLRLGRREIIEGLKDEMMNLPCHVTAMASPCHAMPQHATHATHACCSSMSACQCMPCHACPCMLPAMHCCPKQFHVTFSFQGRLYL